jgi:hypothetical protein
VSGRWATILYVISKIGLVYLDSWNCHLSAERWQVHLILSIRAEIPSIISKITRCIPSTKKVSPLRTVKNAMECFAGHGKLNPPSDLIPSLVLLACLRCSHQMTDGCENCQIEVNPPNISSSLSIQK